MPNAVIDTDETAIVVPADGTKKIRVHGYIFQCDDSVAVKFQSIIPDSATVDLTGPFPNAENTGVPCQLSETPWFETAPGANLTINLSAEVQVSGHLHYSYSV